MAENAAAAWTSRTLALELGEAGGELRRGRPRLLDHAAGR